MTLDERPAPPTDPYAEAERRRAARALVRTPLLHADGHADDLALVRRHQRELVPMFADGLGYRLVVEPTLARLVKTGLHPDATRGQDRHGAGAWTPVAASTARSAADRVFRTWRRGLRKAHQADPDALWAEALVILAATGLVRDEGSTLLVHAAAARYAPRPELVTTADPAGERSLFEEDA